MGKGNRIKAARQQQAAKQAPTTSRRPGHVEQSATRQLPIFWIIVGMILVLGMAVLLWPSGEKSSNAPIKNEAFSKVNVADTGNLSEYRDSYATDGGDPAIGKIAPVVTGEQPSGKKVSIGGAAANPRVIMFVAHWCPHCQKEVPLIQEWKNAGKLPAGVKVETVATNSSEGQPNYPPSKWLADENWTAPVLLDDDVNSAALAYGVKGFPYFAFVDKSGKVVVRASGELSQEKLVKYMKQAAKA